MNNSYKFFENKECEYYPCHKGTSEINCLFCYCPFYSWEECPGVNRYKDKPDGRRIKVCIDCTFPHMPENYQKVMDILKLGKDAFIRSRHIFPSKFYGIGVGPGDPNLITSQAIYTIKAVDVLILPAKDKESCRAYAITKQAVSQIDGKELVFLPFPMSMKEPELKDFHRHVADKVEEYLKENKSVGFLSIGDVSIYSTFAYVEQLVAADGFETEYVTGIPSFCAAAARVGMPLTLGSEEMHIVPGSADIDEALKLSGTLVFMKSGKRLIELKHRLVDLEKKGQIEVAAVSNCGMESEIVVRDAAGITEENGYLTVVIVRQQVVNE